jgi:hypothetical protein
LKATSEQQNEYDQHDTDVVSIESDSSSKCLPFTTVLGYDVTMQVEMEKNFLILSRFTAQDERPSAWSCSPRDMVSANKVTADTSTAADDT